VAGCAWRAWQRLMDAKRRREFLEWALGPDMSILAGKLKASTRSITEDIGGQISELRDNLDALRSKLREEAKVERRETRQLLERKMDKEAADTHAQHLEQTVEEIDALREQLASQAETQRTMSLESERGIHDVAIQIQDLTREVDQRYTQTHKVIDHRAGQEEKALGVVNEELKTIKSTKANHEELVKLVRKLQHRPQPGVPLGVHQLLTVPYPLPPGNMRTAANPRGRGSRPSSAASSRVGGGWAAGGGGGSGSSGALPGAMVGAELREVPTTLSADGDDPDGVPRGLVATSEQILVRPLPSDAATFGPFGGNSSGGRLSGARDARMVPPSSHTPALSARASPTVNAILANRRPASARGLNSASGQTTQISMFDARTSRLERSLGDRGGEGTDAAQPHMA